jgi:hypothetical protein
MSVCASEFEDQQKQNEKEKEKITDRNIILSICYIAAFAHSPSRAHLAISYNQNYSAFSG